MQAESPAAPAPAQDPAPAPGPEAGQEHQQAQEQQRYEQSHARGQQEQYEQQNAAPYDVPGAHDSPWFVAAQLQAGQVRPLAVTTKTRSRSLPDVPTMAELGITNYESYGWFGIAAPKGTPKPVVDRLHSEVVRAVADPSVQARLIEIGVEPVSSTPEAFRAFISAEIVKWRDIITTTGIKNE